jgi:hypothetical protein
MTTVITGTMTITNTPQTLIKKSFIFLIKKPHTFPSALPIKPGKGLDLKLLTVVFKGQRIFKMK